MTPPIDLRPAVEALAAVVAGVRDDQLDDPTPCPDMTVAAILDHIDGFAWALERGARKQTIAEGDAPVADAEHLVPDWRTRIPERLDLMARAWSAPDAWDGGTDVGGVHQTAEETGYVGINEVVVHGWDLARATGQSYAVDLASVEGARRFAARYASDEGIPGFFGPQQSVDDAASPLDELVALTGRDPGWQRPADSAQTSA